MATGVIDTNPEGAPVGKVLTNKHPLLHKDLMTFVIEGNHRQHDKKYSEEKKDGKTLSDKYNYKPKEENNSEIHLQISFVFYRHSKFLVPLVEALQLFTISGSLAGGHLA